jgi:hydrogenase maturation protease
LACGAKGSVSKGKQVVAIEKNQPKENLPGRDMPKIGVIGVGNELMGDDGIGPLLIHRLKASDPFHGGVRLIDASVGGLKIVHELAQLDTAVILDAGDMRVQPGDWRIFSPKAAHSVKPTQTGSVHEWDVMKAIQISEMLGEAPCIIYIMAIQPCQSAFGQSVSAILRNRVPMYLRTVKLLVQKLCAEAAVSKMSSNF